MLKSFSLSYFILFALSLSAQDFYVVDSSYCYAHDPASQTTVPTQRLYNLDFTEEGQILLSRKEELPAWLSTWRNLELTTYQYDAQGFLAIQTGQQWDTVTATWQNSIRTQYTSNQLGNFTHTLNQQWSGSNWKNVDQTHTIYNASGFAETLTHDLWEEGSGSWRKNFRILYARNANGQLIQTKFQLWKQQDNNYYDLSRTSYIYDSQVPEQEIENITEIFNSATSAWEKSSRTVKNYDENGYQVEETVQLWNTLSSNWADQSRILQNFDDGGKLTFRIELAWNGTQWVNLFTTNYVYDDEANLIRLEVSQWQINEWKMLSSCDFYWRLHHQTASAAEAERCPCRVPNPFQPGMDLQCEGISFAKPLVLRLFDLAGRLVFFKKMEGGQSVKMDRALPPGLYLLTISGEDRQLFTQKILVNKGF